MKTQTIQINNKNQTKYTIKNPETVNNTPEIHKHNHLSFKSNSSVRETLITYRRNVFHVFALFGGGSPKAAIFYTKQ